MCENLLCRAAKACDDRASAVVEREPDGTASVDADTLPLLLSGFDLNPQQVRMIAATTGLSLFQTVVEREGWHRRSLLEAVESIFISGFRLGLHAGQLAEREGRA